MQYFTLSSFTGKQFRKQVLFSLLFLFALLLQGFAQPVTVTGKITDEKGEPIAFPSIMIKGTRAGVSADATGVFSIKVNTLPAVLVINSVGHQTVERMVRATDTSFVLSVIMNTSDKALTEVVVTLGYSTRKTSRSLSTDAMPVMSRDIVSRELKSMTTVTDDRPSSGLSSSSPKQNRTKLLTAGELSDFKKWKLWEGYTGSEFKSFSEKWDLYANARYSVQLQNKNSRAVTGQFVYLINSSSGDTVWTAVTDNTGKAELWDRFNSNVENDDKLEIHVKDDSRIYDAKLFDQGINTITINHACTVSAKVEIAIVVDATGSMQDEIDYLKEELGDVLSKVSVKDPSLDLYTSAVFYRDLTDQYVTRVQPFTKDAEQTVDFIKQQSAGGGGDYPEAVKEALEAATGKLQWSEEARTKIIFLVLDAPPHDNAKKELALLIEKAAANGIRIVPVACSGTDKTTEFILRSMALATNGSYIFLTDDSGIGNKHIKPTTDEFKVELLNDLLQRTIEQMCYVNTCEVKTTSEQPLAPYKPIESIKAYPNPTSGPVTLETDLKLKEIYVADFTGKILNRIDVRKRKGRYQLDLSGLPAATYLIRYVTEDGKSGAERIVLVR